jgi:hypothetical protein
MKKQLRKGWKTRVRLAVLDVISLAKDSLTWAQGCAFNHRQKRAAHDLSLPLLACNSHQMFREEIPGPTQGRGGIVPRNGPIRRRAAATSAWSLAVRSALSRPCESISLDATRRRRLDSGLENPAVQARL